MTRSHFKILTKAWDEVRITVVATGFDNREMLTPSFAVMEISPRSMVTDASYSS